MKIKRVRKRRKGTYFGRGTTVSILHPYVNKRNRPMLGEGKKKEGEKQLVNKKAVLLGQSFLRFHLLID